MISAAPGSITQLATGVPGLDEVLGGGIPEYSFNLIGGARGTGKTTLGLQIAFANASASRPAVYFTVLGESPLMARQPFGFFDADNVLRGGVQFVNLSQQVVAHDLTFVRDTIVREVQDRNAGLVVVDSFRPLVRAGRHVDRAEREVHIFLQQLAVSLAEWPSTTFLIGEFPARDDADNPILTIADSVISLRQFVERDATSRTLQVLKVREQQALAGLHPLRISDEGIQLTPVVSSGATDRLSSGSAQLDRMLGGGIPAGDAVLVVGPSGCGQSVLAAQFIGAGRAHGEACVAGLFEESPEAFVARAETLGFDRAPSIHARRVEALDLRSHAITIDEVLDQFQTATRRSAARRVVVDSLVGLQRALDPNSRAALRDAVARLVDPLTAAGSTVMLTSSDSTMADAIGFLVDDVVQLRQLETRDGARTLLSVQKMRASGHRRDERPYTITASGMHVLD